MNLRKDHSHQISNLKCLRLHGHAPSNGVEHTCSTKQLVLSIETSILKVLTMDASARESMKDAAKCDKHCELQNFVIQLKSERNLRKELLASCTHYSEPIFSLVASTVTDSSVVA